MENSVVSEQENSCAESNGNKSIEYKSPRKSRNSTKWQYRPRLRLSNQRMRMSLSVQISKSKQATQPRKSKYALIPLNHHLKTDLDKPLKKQQVKLQPQTQDLYRSFSSPSQNIRVRLPKQLRKQSQFRMKCLSKTDYEAIGRDRMRLVSLNHPKFHNKYILVENRATPLRLFVSNKVRSMMLRDLTSQNHEKMLKSVKNVIDCVNEYDWVNRLADQNILDMDKIVEKRPLKFKKINHVKKMSKKLEL